LLAAAEFHQLKEAYAVLTDKDAKAALNDLLR
jgi:DnaJ-class molecular chaperone